MTYPLRTSPVAATQRRRADSPASARLPPVVSQPQRVGTYDALPPAAALDLQRQIGNRETRRVMAATALGTTTVRRSLLKQHGKKRQSFTVDQALGQLRQRKRLAQYDDAVIREVLRELEATSHVGVYVFTTFKELAGTVESQLANRDWGAVEHELGVAEHVLEDVADWEKTKGRVAPEETEEADDLGIGGGDFDIVEEEAELGGQEDVALLGGGDAGTKAVAKQVIQIAYAKLKADVESGDPALAAKAAALGISWYVELTASEVVDKMAPQTIGELMPMGRGRRRLLKAFDVAKALGSTAEGLLGTIAEFLTVETSQAAQEAIDPALAVASTYLEGKLKKWGPEKKALYAAIRAGVGATNRIPVASNVQATLGGLRDLGELASRPAQRLAGRPYTPASAEELGDPRALSAMGSAIGRTDDLMDRVVDARKRLARAAQPLGRASTARAAATKTIAKLDAAIERLRGKSAKYGRRAEKIERRWAKTAARGKMPLRFGADLE